MINCLIIIININAKNLVTAMNSQFCYDLKCHPLLKSSLDDIPVSQTLIDRLKVQNLILQMRNTSKQSLHDIQTCESCQFQEGEITKQLFIRKNKNFLDEKIISAKIENHLLKHNSLTLIGDIAASLPKPNENRDVVWNKLLRKTK